MSITIKGAHISTEQLERLGSKEKVIEFAKNSRWSVNFAELSKALEKYFTKPKKSDKDEK